MTILLPRLPAHAVDRLLDNILGESGLRWSGFNPYNPPSAVRYAATGGTAIQPARLQRIRDEIVNTARRCGFQNDSVPAGHARFDMECGRWAATCRELNSGEALRDDVWSFLTAVMAPDVVYWRFGAARERYHGGVRNAFQRLWLRAMVLDRGEDCPDRWGLLRDLTEDALVQITERPAIGADPVVARALGEAWVRASARYGRRRMEAVMRLATLRLRIRNEIRALAFLPRETLAALMDDEFARAADEILGPGAVTDQERVHAVPVAVRPA